MWLPWSQFTWSANAVSGNARSIRVIFLAATAASVPMAASISSALDSGGLLFAVPLAGIFLAALLLMVSGLEYGSDEYRSAIRYSIPSIVAMVLIVVGRPVRRRGPRRDLDRRNASSSSPPPSAPGQTRGSSDRATSPNGTG